MRVCVRVWHRRVWERGARKGRSWPVKGTMRRGLRSMRDTLAGLGSVWGLVGAPLCPGARGQASASCSGERPQSGMQLGAPTRAGSKTWIN